MAQNVGHKGYFRALMSWHLGAKKGPIRSFQGLNGLMSRILWGIMFSALQRIGALSAVFEAFSSQNERRRGYYNTQPLKFGAFLGVRLALYAVQQQQSCHFVAAATLQQYMSATQICTSLCSGPIWPGKACRKFAANFQNARRRTDLEETPNPLWPKMSVKFDMRPAQFFKFYI